MGRGSAFSRTTAQQRQIAAEYGDQGADQGGEQRQRAAGGGRREGRGLAWSGGGGPGKRRR